MNPKPRLRQVQQVCRNRHMHAREHNSIYRVGVVHLWWAHENYPRTLCGRTKAGNFGKWEAPINENQPICKKCWAKLQGRRYHGNGPANQYEKKGRKTDG